MDLHQAITVVNIHNRPGGRLLIVPVRCLVCGAEFARAVSDASLAGLHGRRIICPHLSCQREARRRQRGE